MFEAYSVDGAAIENVAEGDDVVVMQLHSWGCGAGSGIPVDPRWAHTFRLRDAKVLRVDTYGRYVKALEAAGLSE
jgi:ketosteroid isomerase-like protein